MERLRGIILIVEGNEALEYSADHETNTGQEDLPAGRAEPAWV